MSEEKKQKCLCCEKEVDSNKGMDIRISDDDGFMKSCGPAFICEDCMEKNSFVIGSTRIGFIRTKDNVLYCQYYPPYGNFERIRSDAAIDRAFNPERYAFREWLNKR
jgi:hypothetical protein